MRYICQICGYVYDEAENAPWAELPDDWKCPLCGASKSDFVPEGSPAAAAEPGASGHEDAELKPLTAAETSALCTSLAKGCEKQYRPEQADAFRKLAAWFKAQGGGGTGASFDLLMEKSTGTWKADFRPGTRPDGNSRTAARCAAWPGARK